MSISTSDVLWNVGLLDAQNQCWVSPYKKRKTKDESCLQIPYKWRVPKSAINWSMKKELICVKKLHVIVKKFIHSYSSSIIPESDNEFMFFYIYWASCVYYLVPNGGSYLFNFPLTIVSFSFFKFLQFQIILHMFFKSPCFFYILKNWKL